MSPEAGSPEVGNREAGSREAGSRGAGSRWAGRLVRLVMVLAVLLGLLYLGDWAVLRVRVSRGTAYGVIQVNQFLATPLKGNKVEYDFMGTAPVRCSHSIFPQQGSTACWWLQRHASQWE